MPRRSAIAPLELLGLLTGPTRVLIFGIALGVSPLFFKSLS